MTTKANPNRLFCQTLPAAEGSSPFSDVQLIQFVLQSVQELQWPKGFEHFRSEDGRAVNARMLVSLLAYCYSKGVFDMYEIENRFAADPAFAYLSAHQFPGWNTLRHFRRRHKRLIIECLAILFCRLQSLRFQSACVSTDSDLGAWNSRGFLSRHRDEMTLALQKSAALVNRAVQSDCMAMDD